MDRIVVGIDESVGSQRALEWALAEARERGDELRLVHAVPPTETYYPYSTVAVRASEWQTEEAEAAAQEMLTGALEKAGGAEGVTVDLATRGGLPVGVLIDESRSARLVVVGSRDRGGFAGLLLGSVSQQVVQHAECPVVVIPAV